MAFNNILFSSSFLQQITLSVIYDFQYFDFFFVGGGYIFFFFYQCAKLFSSFFFNRFLITNFFQIFFFIYMSGFIEKRPSLSILLFYLFIF